MAEFRTRKEQIEKDFYGAIRRACKLRGVNLPRSVVSAIKEELRGAAMVGACEERDRALKILREQWTNAEASQAINAKSVLEVLGYQD